VEAIFDHIAVSTTESCKTSITTVQAIKLPHRYVLKQKLSPVIGGMAACYSLVLKHQYALRIETLYRCTQYTRSYILVPYLQLIHNTMLVMPVLHCAFHMHHYQRICTLYLHVMPYHMLVSSACHVHTCKPR
jgi:hypothetical protein